MKEELLQIQATLVKVETMSHKSLRLRFDSQESVPETVVNRLMDSFERLGWLCFLPEKKILVEDIKDLPEITDESDRKSPSQRLRGTLYVVWKSKSEPYKKKYPFEVFYRQSVDDIITKLREKLP